MAKKDAKKNYVTLDDVRVFYDKNTDTIHLTSKDKDLPKTGNGFKINLTTGRDSELALRALLRNKGVIEEGNVTPKDIPTRVEYPKKSSAKVSEIPLGVNARSEIVWDTQADPHLLIVSNAGSGRTVLNRNIELHCAKHSDAWDFVSIDTSRIGSVPHEKIKYDPRFEQPIRTWDEVYRILRATHKELSKRNQKVLDSKLERKDAPTFDKSVIVLINGAQKLLDYVDTFHVDSAQNAFRLELLSYFMDIVTLGAEVGVHLVLSTQYLKDSDLTSELQENITACIAIGRMDSHKSNVTLGNNKATFTGTNPGRAYFQRSSGAEQFQIYISKPEAVSKAS